MKNLFVHISAVILVAILALVAVEANNFHWSGIQPESSATLSTDDAGVQKCIADKFAAAPSLKSQGFTVSVSGGVATLTGNAKNAGSKGSATMIAKRCGAQSVVNNITIAKPDDSAIQKCITDRFAASLSLKTQGFSASVNGGVATLTGDAKDAGSKGAATNIAKRCGARTVTNNITVPKSKPAAKNTSQ